MQSANAKGQREIEPPRVGGGGLLPIMAYTRGSALKGYLFKASGIEKGRDFTS